MLELNHSTLQQAIRDLPTHEAPGFVWEAIEDGLALEDQLATDLKKLPQYEAPDAIWEQLDRQLGQKQTPSNWSVRVNRRWMVAAAAMLILVAGWWLIRSGETEEVAIAFSEVQLDDRLRSTLDEKEDDAFGLIEELCQSRAPVCDLPDFKNLKSELEELNDAKTSLKSALGDYGDDPGLTAQLVRIERERSELLRQMMSMI